MLLRHGLPRAYIAYCHMHLYLQAGLIASRSSRVGRLVFQLLYLGMDVTKDAKPGLAVHAYTPIVLKFGNAMCSKYPIDGLRRMSRHNETFFRIEISLHRAVGLELMVDTIDALYMWYRKHIGTRSRLVMNNLRYFCLGVMCGIIIIFLPLLSFFY